MQKYVHIIIDVLIKLFKVILSENTRRAVIRYTMKGCVQKFCLISVCEF